MRSRAVAAVLGAVLAGLAWSPTAGVALVRVNQSGAVLVLHERSDPAGLYAYAAAPAAPLKASGQRLSTQAACGHDVRLNDRGDAIVAWRDCGSKRLRVSYRPAGGQFGSAQELGVTAALPALDLTDAGDAAIAWRRGGKNFLSVATNGVFAPASEAPGADAPRFVALDPARTATVLWGERTMPQLARSYAATKPIDGSFSEPESLAAVAEHDIHPAGLHVDRDGSAVAIVSVADTEQEQVLHVVERAPGGTFGPAYRLSSTKRDPSLEALAIRDDGALVAVWSEQERFLGARFAAIWQAVRRPGGKFEGHSRLARDGTFPSEGRARIHLDGRGNLRAAWDEKPFALMGGQVLAARAAGGGGFGPTRLVARALRIKLLDFDAGPTVEATLWTADDGERTRTLVRLAGPGRRRHDVLLDARRSYERAEPCQRAGKSVLLRTSFATVMARGADRTVACSAKSGATSIFDIVYGFRPPGMALAGSLFAYASDCCAGGNETPLTSIEVYDLRQERSSVRWIPAVPTYEIVDVGAVRLRPDGALAWTVCPDNYGDFSSEARQPCRSSRYVNRVYALSSSGETVQLLDRDRGIDPRSLQLRGTKLTWMKDGRRRSARLP